MDKKLGTPLIQIKTFNTITEAHCPLNGVKKLQEARIVASHHSVIASDKSADNYNSHMFPIKFSLGQLVWLNEFRYLGRNNKIISKLWLTTSF